MRIICVRKPSVLLPKDCGLPIIKEGNTYHVKRKIKTKDKRLYYELREQPDCYYLSDLFLPVSKLDEILIHKELLKQKSVA